MFASANSYIFSVSYSTVLNPPGANFGDTLSGYNSGGSAAQGILYTAANYGFDAAGNYGAGPFTTPTATTVLSDVYYSTAGNGTNASASENGLSATHSISNSVTSTTSFEIGARTSGGGSCCANRVWAGTIDEVIFYNNLSSALTATQITQIRSYLAIKYGITLGFNTQTQAVTATNYLSSAGTTVWSGASNTAYENDVAGIGKDTTSGLDQRVSHSINSSSYGNSVDVTIANGSTLSTASQTANSAFGSDQTFVMWGDNGNATTLTVDGNVSRMARVWLVQVTGSGSTKLTVRVPASALSGVANPEIFVSASGTSFGSATGTALTCGGAYCTATISTFSGTQYFSFGTTAPPTNLGAQPDYNSATLQWTAVSGASYNVYRGTTSGSETLLGSVAAITSASTYPMYYDSGATNGTTYYYYVTAVSNGIESSSSAEVTAALPSFSAYTAEAYQVLTAASTVSGYAADGSVENGGGTLSHTTHAVNATAVISSPAPAGVYQYERFANAFYYAFSGLRQGATYIVRLHFAELHFGSASGACTNSNCTGSRVFNVTINGAAALTNFDIWAQAGAVYTAIGRDFAATADSSGTIYVALCSTSSLTSPTTCTAPSAGANQAKIDAIQIYSAPPVLTLVLSASTSTPVPGSDVTYTTNVVNSGAAPSSNTAITIPVPSPTCFKVGTATQPTGSAGVVATISYSNDGGSTFTYTPVSGACGSASSGYDTAVTHVRWTLSGSIPATSTSNSAYVAFAARVP